MSSIRYSTRGFASRTFKAEMSMKNPLLQDGAREGLTAAETPFKRFVANYFESRVATVAFFVLVVILILGFFAPLISPTDPYDLAQVDVLDSRLVPGSESYTGMTYWLGTDGAGRDLLSAILYGLRTSLSVGVLSRMIDL